MSMNHCLSLVLHLAPAIHNSEFLKGVEKNACSMQCCKETLTELRCLLPVVTTHLTVHVSVLNVGLLLSILKAISPPRFPSHLKFIASHLQSK